MDLGSIPLCFIDSWLPSGDLACGYHQWNLPLQFDDFPYRTVDLQCHDDIVYSVPICPDDIPVYGHLDGLNPYSIHIINMRWLSNG